MQRPHETGTWDRHASSLLGMQPHKHSNLSHKSSHNPHQSIHTNTVSETSTVFLSRTLYEAGIGHRSRLPPVPHLTPNLSNARVQMPDRKSAHLCLLHPNPHSQEMKLPSRPRVPGEVWVRQQFIRFETSNDPRVWKGLWIDQDFRGGSQELDLGQRPGKNQASPGAREL